MLNKVSASSETPIRASGVEVQSKGQDKKNMTQSIFNINAGTEPDANTIVVSHELLTPVKAFYHVERV